MRKTLVCIFAHPDDEAFGPGGTIAKFAKEYDVYILCATKGGAGEDSVGEGESLAEVRAKELLASARILGVKEVFFLGFSDGELCNNLYHKLAKKISEHLEKLKPETLLTFEPRGVSGHIDHIVVGMVSMFVFNRLPFVKKILQHVARKETSDARKDYFIYFPPGYTKEEVDLVVDTSDSWDTKREAMQQHKSQAKDIRAVLAIQEKIAKEEFFLVMEK